MKSEKEIEIKMREFIEEYDEIESKPKNEIRICELQKLIDFADWILEINQGS